MFVNIGGPLPPEFSGLYGFDSASVVAATYPESILRYSLFESPLTILMSPEGQAERVWVGELSSTDVANIKKTLASVVQGE